MVSDENGGFVDPWLAQQMAPQLTEQDKAFRDLFVGEYLVDYQAIAAAIRCGLSRAFAEDFAKKFMAEPYVQQEIKRLEGLHEAPDTPGEEGVDPFRTEKAKIKAMLFREASGASPGSTASARVAALSKLMSMYGMDAPVKTEANVTHKGGVTVYLPDNGRATAAQTAAAATVAQAAAVVPGP